MRSAKIRWMGMVLLLLEVIATPNSVKLEETPPVLANPSGFDQAKK
jgi:hypothetical protein